MKTSQKGSITELECILAFNKYDFKVSIPYGEDCRYDCIVDVNNHLLRIQVKTPTALISPSTGEVSGIYIHCCSMRVNSTENIRRKYNADEIDYFATYWDNVCYVIPVDECSDVKTLRFPEHMGPTEIKSGMNLASQYTIEQQFASFVDTPIELVDPITYKNSSYQKTNSCIQCGTPIDRKSIMCKVCRQQLLDTNIVGTDTSKPER